MTPPTHAIHRRAGLIEFGGALGPRHPCRVLRVGWLSHVRVAQVSLPGAAVTPLRALPTTPSASRARSVVVPRTQYPDYESLHGPSLGRIIYLNKPKVHVLDPRSKRPEQLAELFVGIQVRPRRESSTFHGDPLRKGCSRGFPRTSRWPGNVLKDARPEVVGPRCGHTDVQVALPWFAEQIDAGYHRDLSALGRINGRSGQKLADATSKEVRVVPDVIIHGHNASFSALWSPAAVTTRTTDALYSLATAARSLPNVAARPRGPMIVDPGRSYRPELSFDEQPQGDLASFVDSAGGRITRQTRSLLLRTTPSASLLPHACVPA